MYNNSIIIVIFLLLCNNIHGFLYSYTGNIKKSVILKKMQLKMHNPMDSMTSIFHSSQLLSDAAIEQAIETTSLYSKVDKTGFIGFIADYVERTIDFGRDVIHNGGIENGYGFSIILFTIFGKSVVIIIILYINILYYS